MLNASSVDFSTNQSSLQSKIYDLQRNHARDSLVDSFNDLKQIAWNRSNVADDARHAAYLSVLPKNPFFTFSNEEMLILTRRLLYLDIHLHIPGISKCCNNHKHANCDSKGTQMSVCTKGGYRIQTHDALNLEIQSMLSLTGICPTREERGIFQTNTFDCNKRGKLTVLISIDC